MKPLIQRTLLMIAVAILPVISWAQDKKVDVDINLNKKNDNWFQQPWVWVVGACLFILLLVAILRPARREG
jgi:hypothetical protein